MPDSLAPSIIPTVPNGTPNEDDVLLNDDSAVVESEDLEDEDEDEDEDEHSPTKKDEEDSESKEEEVDEDDEDEEGKKSEIPFDRPSVKDIKAKFPEFFKEFPELKEAFFREQEFTKVFPTVEEAREAAEENVAFSTLSDAALDGDPAPLLESLEKTDAKALKIFSAGFLPALYKRNQEVYHEVVTPVFENLIKQLYKSTDENMRNSALNIAQYIFGEEHAEAIAQGKKTFSTITQLTDEQKKLKERRDQEVSTKFRETYNHVETQINSSLKALILKDFDPNKVFSKFMRNQLADEVVKRIHVQLRSDKAHSTIMSSRWKRAKSNGYTNDDKSKIISTFLARAKSLIPGTSDKVRNLAHGKVSKHSDIRREKIAPERREVNGGRAPNGRASKEVDYRKMSDMDILNLGD